MLVQLSACLNRNTISIKDSNIGDTIQILQNLSITFNRDLVPDSLIDKWDSTTYLKIEPSIKM